MKYSPSKYEQSSLYMLYFETTNISSSPCQLWFSEYVITSLSSWKKILKETVAKSCGVGVVVVVSV